MKGERVDIARTGYDSTMNAFHGKATVTIVNAGPATTVQYEPSDDEPAALVAAGPGGDPIVVPVRAELATGPGPMFGGTYAELGYGAFAEAASAIAGVKLRGAIPIHDRYETWEEYEVMSR